MGKIEVQSFKKSTYFWNFSDNFVQNIVKFYHKISTIFGLKSSKLRRFFGFWKWTEDEDEEGSSDKNLRSFEDLWSFVTTLLCSHSSHFFRGLCLSYDELKIYRNSQTSDKPWECVFICSLLKANYFSQIVLFYKILAQIFATVETLLKILKHRISTSEGNCSHNSSKIFCRYCSFSVSLASQCQSEMITGS